MARKTYKSKKRNYKKKRYNRNIRKTKRYRRYRTVKSNPGWNPQYMKLKRVFQFSAPIVDVPSPITSGIQMEDPYVLSSASGTSKVTTYAFFGMTFTASQIPDITNYSTLFDQYLISYIKLKFDYMSSSGSDMVYSNVNLPRCEALVWTDFDDIATPGTNLSGWQKVMETGRAKRKFFPNNYGNSFSVGFKPRILLPVVDTGAGVTARMSSGPRWLDGATALEAPHYGVKLMLQANPTTPATYHFFRVTAQFYLKFKQRKTL